MFPVPKELLMELNFSEIKKTDDSYHSLLVKELRYLNHNQDSLVKMAQKVYKIGLNKNHFLNKNCCDFKKLEEAMDKYDKFN